MSMLMDLLLIGLDLKTRRPLRALKTLKTLRPLRALRPPGVLLWLLALALRAAPAAGGACPLPCRCDSKLLYCEGRGLGDVPLNLSGALGLSLRDNNLTALREGRLPGLLTWLHLDHNAIALVEEGAFRRLRRLKELDLGSNRIEELPNATFRPLPNLRLLDLSSNRLRALPPQLFRGLRKLSALRLRSNRLSSVPVRIFQDCRALRLLDLGYNRLLSLARNAFAGLLQLGELHLEHNQLAKVNLAHFPRLVALRSLYLHHNRAALVVNTLNWTWPLLEKIDLSANRIEFMEPHVFESAPNLRELLLANNRLRSVDARTLASWASLGSVSLAANAWDCGRNVCALASWLGAFAGRRDAAPRCSSPDAAQGEDLLDAVSAFRLCEDPPERATAEGPHASAGGAELLGPFTPDPRGGREVTAGPGDLESAVRIHKVVTGTVALVFSFLIVALVLYVAWKCFPAGLRQLRRCFGSRRRKQKQKQSAQQMAAISTPEYYVDYKPHHIEGALVIINEYGSCTCQQPPARECEV